MDQQKKSGPNVFRVAYKALTSDKITKNNSKAEKIKNKNYYDCHPNCQKFFYCILGTTIQNHWKSPLAWGLCWTHLMKLRLLIPANTVSPGNYGLFKLTPSFKTVTRNKWETCEHPIKLFLQRLLRLYCSGLQH